MTSKFSREVDYFLATHPGLEYFLTLVTYNLFWCVVGFYFGVFAGSDPIKSAAGGAMFGICFVVIGGAILAPLADAVGYFNRGGGE